MENARERIQALMRQGEAFEFSTFATRSLTGHFADALSPEWVGWCKRVEQTVEDLVQPNSSALAMIHAARNVAVRGNGPQKFEEAKSQYIGALEAVLQMLDNDMFNELRPVPRKSTYPANQSSGDISQSPVLAIPQGRVVIPRLTKGMQLDAYELQQRLGRGMSAEVWKAVVIEPILGVDLEPDATVAVKIYHLTNRGFESLRVEREFAIASQSEHKNLARVYDLVLSPNRPFRTFMVMEYVPGPTLKTFIEGHQTLSATRTLTIAAQLFDALVELHSLDAIHRDVKAGNIILPKSDDDDIQIKLVDLGIVSVTSHIQATAASVFLGSKHSAPLEQLQGKELDVRTDIYGAGSVLFHCLTGKPMYESVGPEAAIATRMLQDPVKLPLSSNADPWVKVFEEFINSCIAVDAKDRPQTARECQEEVAGLVRVLEKFHSTRQSRKPGPATRNQV